MAQSNQPTGPKGEPVGPPAGHNGLGMYPTECPAPEPPPSLHDSPPKKPNWGQRITAMGSKAAAPLNMLANKLGAEAFLPGTLDKECEKAARILRSFCKDGIYTDAHAPETVETPTLDASGKPTTAPARPRKNRTLLTIPSKVVGRAVGLAIFTTARAGFHVSGATGSGVLVARLPDGSWSPPSGIQVHSVGAGLMIGIDIYDCVVVINSRDALEAFTKTRVSLGSDLAVVAGPWGAGGSVDFAAPKGKPKDKDAAAEGAAATAKDSSAPVAADGYVHDVKDTAAAAPPPAAADAKVGTPPVRASGAQARQPSGIKQAMKQPIYSYVKSRGFYAGVQVDGTIVTERKDANAIFYGEPVGVQQILSGEVPRSPPGRWADFAKPLLDTIKGAEGWHGQGESAATGGGANTQQWANQMGPDPSSTHGAAHDPVFSKGENAPPKPPRPTTTAADGTGTGGGVTAGVANLSLGGGSFPPPPPRDPPSDPTAAGASNAPPTTETPSRAQAKAAEAAAEAEMNREREERERRELAGVADPRASTATAPPPGYTETASAAGGGGGGGAVGDEGPPAYVDDGTARHAGVGDSKGQAGGEGGGRS